MDFLPLKRALLSVTHKDGLADFAAFLHANGVELVSTGGTLKFLENAGLPVTAVSDVTGFPKSSGAASKPCTRTSTAASSRTRTTPSTSPCWRKRASSPSTSSA